MASVVVALLARIGSPPGTMLVQGAHGPILVLCTGDGPMVAPPAATIAMTMPMGKAHSPTPVKPRHGGTCEFAAHAGSALTTPAMEPLVYAHWSPAAISPPVVFATTGLGLAAPPPPSHAPPSSLV